MFTRFKQNVVQYPRLFTATLVIGILAIVESYIPLLVGIDQPHLRRVFAVEFVLAFILAVVLYRWVTSGARRSILTDILNRFEGREVCTVSEHYVSDETTEEDNEEEDNPETYA